MTLVHMAAPPIHNKDGMQYSSLSLTMKAQLVMTHQCLHSTLDVSDFPPVKKREIYCAPATSACCKSVKASADGNLMVTFSVWRMKLMSWLCFQKGWAGQFKFTQNLMICKAGNVFAFWHVYVCFESDASSMFPNKDKSVQWWQKTWKSVKYYKKHLTIEIWE